MNLTVITTDGSTAAPSAQDQTLMQKARTLIESDPHFQALRAPALSRAEVNAGVAVTAPGYLYLRYDVPGAVPQELWAHWGKADHVAWKSGQVTVQQG